MIAYTLDAPANARTGVTFLHLTEPLMRHWARTACAVATALASLTVAACDNKRDNSKSETDRSKSQVNLKQVAEAMHSHHDGHGRFPDQARMQGKGGLAPGGLSWRVHLLPYLKESGLYGQFNLDEPWDSENNKKLIERMPQVYSTPGVTAGVGQTYLKVFAGPGAPFEPARITARSLTAFTDGTANTIMVVEGGTPVIWTKPDDFPFDPKKHLPDLSLAGERKVNIVTFDAIVRVLDLDKISEDTLKAAITHEGGEMLGPDWAAATLEVPNQRR